MDKIWKYKDKNSTNLKIVHKIRLRKLSPNTLVLMNKKSEIVVHLEWLRVGLNKITTDYQVR
jgi:hypothetical protein